MSLINKKIKTAKLSKIFNEEGYQKRREWVEENTGVKLTDERNNTESLQGIIENHVGFVSVPLGIAAPLTISESTYAKGEYAVPLCTVEGALVASMTRGMLATSKSGGVKTSYIRQQISRAPFFILKDITHVHSFMNYIEEKFDKIKKVAESTTRFGKLIKINKYPIHNYVVLDFIYSTSNAAGQNMVSICTDQACKYIKEQTKMEYYLESNFSGDKKASALNTIRGRGHYVTAEAYIDPATLKRVLGCDVNAFIEFTRFASYASSFSGTQGIQLHVSNALAAIYIATGQDAACVSENSIGFTFLKEISDGGFRISLTMPSITVGTIGGGTRLIQQRRNLEMLGCVEGEHASKKFSEIVCASALCLEISLLSAIVSERWVTAHQRYGRQK